MKKIALLATLILFAVPALAADPLGSAFHGLSITTLTSNIDYWPSRGLYPQTVSVYKPNGGILAAGSFDDRASSDSRINANIYESDIVDLFGRYSAEGYCPRDISALDDSSHIPRFSVIWEKVSVPCALYVGMSDSGFNTRYQEWVVQKGFRIAEHAVYTDRVGSRPAIRRHIAVFKKDGLGFYFHHGLDVATFRDITMRMKAQGYSPATINLGTNTSGESFSVIYLRPSAAIVVQPEMTPEGYQSEFTRLNSAGYRLIKVVAYRKGQRFAGIWQKR